MKKLLHNIVLRRTTDLLLSPVTLLSAVWYKYIRSASARKMPVSEQIFRKVGILPVDDNYYQPLVNPTKHLKTSLDEDRHLPGIDWNMEKQLSLLDSFTYQEELKQIPFHKKEAKELEYYYNNHSFVGGDGEFLYNIIRYFKPKKFVEVGCGYSTMMSVKAEQKNANQCRHICIEPYEMPWLEKLNVEVHRRKVEEMDMDIFRSLQANDILFIDSSHVIRPQGDVLVEFLEILPQLNSGVLVHVHDIFTPKDYPAAWIIDEHRLWNEQYLLEAFLTCNNQFKIIGALNMLKHKHPGQFHKACPHSALIEKDEPGSFWMIKN